ncbi:MAG: bifunctional UDP-N-acetylglucosamine diphosphorylase/glucosamine-1-phosphate N-acetyltransferase GlmU [Actinobacteria bacterium]|nr:bifunctional UDP-N-acetylglucosamine diphosphorylase/glucosamine-1-phosphate N-acetyltransferase GlmU [Actinomycetota bacterium]
MSLSSIIMAAGKGKRMNSSIPKVLHKVAGKPMIEHILNIPFQLKAFPIVVVIGHNGEEVEKFLSTLPENTEVVWQDKLLGTGDAVMRALPSVKNRSEHVLVLCGDTPLLTLQTVRHLVDSHLERKPACTILTAKIDNPAGYGRVIRDEDGFVVKIVEDVDATKEEKQVNEVNAGVYVFDVNLLEEGLESLDSSNNQNEYYLPEVINYFVTKGYRVDAVKAKNAEEIRGVNSRTELYHANKAFFMRKAYELMESGVTIIDPQNTYIEADVSIGKDTIVYPNTYLQGFTVIGSNCEIGPNSFIRDCKIGDGVVFVGSYAIESEVSDQTKVGPFAYLRPGTKVGKNAKVGTFVEIKNTEVGDFSKVPHLSYIGDAHIGQNVNIGAGTITCNYDGVKKHKTVIEDEAFVGSDTIMVAPLKVGKGAYTAAGSVLTEDVPPYSLGIARTRQENKEGWVKRKSLKKEVTDGEG